MATDATGVRPETRLVVAYRQLMRETDQLIRIADTKLAADTRLRAEGLRVGGIPLTGAEGARLRVQRDKVRTALRAEIGAELAFVQDEMAQQYLRSGASAQLSLQQSGVPVLQGSFTGFDRGAVRALQTRVSDRLSSVRQALTQGLALGDGGGGIRQTAKNLEQIIRGDSELVRWVGGELKVLTPSGKFWDPTAYSRMLGRTAIADSRRVSFRQRYLQNGVDVVRVVANGSKHDVCRVWEGQLLSLTGETPGLPTVDDARAAGLFHPNCRHRYVVAREASRLENAPAAIPASALELDEDPQQFSTLGFQPVGSRNPDRRPPPAPRTPTTSRNPPPRQL